MKHDRQTPLHARLNKLLHPRCLSSLKLSDFHALTEFIAKSLIILQIFS